MTQAEAGTEDAKLIERLRCYYIGYREGVGIPDPDCNEAADRLAVLSEENERLRGVLDVIGNQMWAGQVSEVAREALTQQKNPEPKPGG